MIPGLVYSREDYSAREPMAGDVDVWENGIVALGWGRQRKVLNENNFIVMRVGLQFCVCILGESIADVTQI